MFNSNSLPEKTIAINRKFFFDYVRLNLFDGRIRRKQLDGLNEFLNAWESGYGRHDDRWLAYMLGTAHHETGRLFQAVRETNAESDDRAIRILQRAYDSGDLPQVKRPYWKRDDEGRCWLGRGFVQLTHRSNYEKVGALLGIDLLSDPSIAMRTEISVRILMVGMIKGAFTGLQLDDFFKGDKAEWVQARRIVNGLDRAELVASYALKYYAAISYTSSL